MRWWIPLFIFIILLSACKDSSTETSVQPQTNEVPQEEKEQESLSGKEEEGTDMNVEKIEEGEEESTSLDFTLNTRNWTLQPTTDTEDKYVLLTIDDAPDEHAVEMAHILAKKEVPAIFFVNGHFLESEEQKEALTEIHELGFEIGNHSMTHANLRDLSYEETEREIVQLNNIIEDIIGEQPTYFRAPFGVNTEASKDILEKEDMIWMNWTYGYDWEEGYMEKEALADIMVNTELLTNGANLLLHDREWTKEALPLIIEGLRKKGYVFIDPDQIENEY